MELNAETQKGFWAKDNNSNNRFFIYNEALIEKLCILGESVEPCFEGAQFKTEFSLESMEEFRTTMFSMLTELQETLNKGGSHETMDENKKTLGNPEDPNFEAKKKPEDEDKKNPEGNPAPEDNKPKDGDNKPADNNKEEPKKKYNLDEVTEYTELLGKYEALQGEFEALKKEKGNLETEVTSLREFKVAADRKEKQNMINGFYMLNDEDKKDVVEHIDTYSLDDIEAKLSILCVRNKVSFNLDNEDKKDDNQPKGLFNLENQADDNVPEWIKAVRETAKKL
nr:MAG TPA: Homeobox associated leucine zipper [Caudoviricetes sp.]